MSLASFRDVLTLGARRLWDSPDERRAAFRAIIEATDPVAKREAVERVDRAVLEALNALGLPRGPIRGLELWPELVLWNGRKHPDCTLFLSEIRLADAVRFNEVDSFFSSWIHESFHARQAYQGDFHEYRGWPGYEEGLVETLTQRILIAGGISNVSLSYPYYTTAYEILSAAVEIELDLLLTTLWSYPTGRVRHVFAATINELRFRAGRPALDRLQLVGDVVFRADRDRDHPDRESMMIVIRRILR